MVIARRRRGLDEEDVLATHVFLDFHERFAVRKGADDAFAQFNADILANLPGQGLVRCAAENFHNYIKILADSAKNKKPPTPVTFTPKGSQTLATGNPGASVIVTKMIQANG